MNKRMSMLAIPVAVALLMQGTLPVQALGSSEITAIPISAVESNVAKAQVKVTLEEAIAIVKKNFTIPEDFKDFTSGYNSYNERQTWSLNWNATAQTGGSFNAQVDVTTGEIINMNSWKPVKSSDQNGVIKYSYDEAKDIALDLVDKILSDRFDELELVPENSQIIPVLDYGYTTYTVQWKRVANGVPFPSNGVSIQVNAYDGSISSYSLTWSKESIPDVKDVIGTTKARDAFSNNKLLELQYYLSSGIRPLDSSIKDSKKDALLVYQLSNKSFDGMIDAKTGEPIILNPGEWLNSDYIRDGMGGFGGDGNSAEKQALTPEEQKEVEDSAKLITQEKAIESVKKWVEIPENLVLRSVNLGFDGTISQKRVWTLDWSSEETDGYKYVYGRVDAITGEVLGFNDYASAQSPKSPSAIDRTKAKAISDAFLKKIQPNRVNEVQFLEVLDNGQKYPADQPNHDFRYQRLVNGTPVASNGFSISVDRNTQKVVSYEMDFADVNFPAVSRAMSQQLGEDAFLNKRPMELRYVQISKNGKLGDIRLVYQPQVYNRFTVSSIMDAKTGEFLDWQGKPITEQPRPYNFSDLGGSFAEKEIKLLGQAGAFGEYDDKFKPNEKITVESLLRAMLIAKNGVWSDQGLTDEELLKQVKDLGWVKEDIALANNVSRDLQAKLVVRMLDWEKIAQLEGLFQAPYVDADTFSKGSLGYIALTKGLDVMKIDGDKFEPNLKLSRAEAAYAIVKSLQASR